MPDKFLWRRGGIIYQIYPRSFAYFDNDGIGNLQRIINKSYNLQSPGIDAIWLSPIFPSPFLISGTMSPITAAANYPITYPKVNGVHPSTSAPHIQVG
jgi:glycosidase